MPNSPLTPGTPAFPMATSPPLADGDDEEPAARHAKRAKNTLHGFLVGEHLHEDGEEATEPSAPLEQNGRLVRTKPTPKKHVTSLSTDAYVSVVACPWHPSFLACPCMCTALRPSVGRGCKFSLFVSCPLYVRCVSALAARDLRCCVIYSVTESEFV